MFPRRLLASVLRSLRTFPDRLVGLQRTWWKSLRGAFADRRVGLPLRFRFVQLDLLENREKPGAMLTAACFSSAPSSF